MKVQRWAATDVDGSLARDWLASEGWRFSGRRARRQRHNIPAPVAGYPYDLCDISTVMGLGASEVMVLVQAFGRRNEGTMTETKPKKKMGRPLKNPGEARTVAIQLRVTPSEREVILQGAKLTGVSTTQFICMVARKFVEDFSQHKSFDAGTGDG